MDNSEFLEGLAYSAESPDIHIISQAYQQDVDSHSGYADQVADSYNQRRLWWPGKTIDQKKHSVNAKPWRFSSDVEVPVIDPRINTLVALCMNAIRSGQITAAPVSGEDVEQSAATSTFIRWMLDCWIPNSYDQIEMSLNNMFEKGIAATWCGWEKSLRVHKEEIDLEFIAQEAPEIAEMLADEEREEEVIEMLQSSFEAVNKKRAKKALKQLREFGVAEIPVVKGDINRPSMIAKCPRADFLMPQYTMDTRRADRMHVRHFMSIQDLRSAVVSEGWDEDEVDLIIERYMGMTQSDIEGPYGNRDANQANQQATLFNLGNRDAEDLVEIVETYMRQIDEEDGAIGYYRTIWCPKAVRNNKDAGHLLHELLNGWDEMPIAITTLTRDAKRIYDQRNVSDLLRGNQRLQKVIRDALVDQQSISMNPPRTHPAGRPAAQWGAGADFATRRGEEGLYRTLDIPDTGDVGMRFAEVLMKEADMVMGLDPDSQMSVQRQQYFVNRALQHVSDCARLAYKGFQKFYDGPDIHLRVTNQPDPITVNSGYMDDELDIKIFYDVRNLDPEHVQETVKGLISLKQSDMENDLDGGEVMRVATYMTAPQYADRILRPKAESQQDVIDRVLKDLGNMQLGAVVNANTQGAEIALQFLGQWEQQPIAQQHLSNQAFLQLYIPYKQQYEMHITQFRDNAMRGRNQNPDAMVQSQNV